MRAACLLTGFLLLAPAPASAQAGPAGARPAPPLDWRLEALDGRTVHLADLVGRPVVLNVWATWCLPCVAELRSLERLARSPEGAGATFVLVAPQERSAVAAWVGRRGYRLPFYVEGTRMPSEFRLEAVPTTWILDRRGRVVIRHRGAADWDRQDVRALLAALGGLEDG